MSLLSIQKCYMRVNGIVIILIVLFLSQKGLSRLNLESPSLGLTKYQLNDVESVSIYAFYNETMQCTG